MVIFSQSRHSLVCGAVPCKALIKGFTIIECLISILLLAIVMAGGMAFYFYSTGYLASATHRRIAAEMANARLEQIKNSGYANLPDPAPGLWDDPSVPGVPPEPVTIGSLPGQQEVYIFDIDENGGGTDYKQAEVKITWTEPSKTGPQEMVLETYIVRQ